MRLAKPLLALAALVATLLLAEGLLSLVAGRSLAELAGRRPAEVREWRAPTDDDLIEAAARNPGHYRVHVDPAVGMTMKAEATFDIFEGAVTTDASGMRSRPGPPPPEDAYHVVVLGDSVAFGFGVDDDEVLAHRLEVLLNDVRVPGAVPVVCSTVAVPGWNLVNSTSYLLDHLDEIDPDVVLLLPIGNDLANTYSVRDTGHRRDAPDILTRDPWLRVSVDATQFVLLEAARRLNRRGDLPAAAGFDPETLGPPCLNADLSRESSLRFDAASGAVHRLHEVLSRRGTHLALLHYFHERFAWHLLHRLADLGEQLPVVPLLKQIEREFTLGFDLHPNATTHDVLATWCAEFLLDRGWVPDALGHARLPVPPAEYRKLRSPLWPRKRRALQVDKQKQEDLAMLQPAVELDTARGLYQVYGGLNPDGTAAPALLVVLADAGPRLEIVLETLEDREVLLPLEVDVLVDGVPCASKAYITHGRHVIRVDLAGLGPEGRRDGAPREVEVRASPYTVTRYSGRPQLTSYRLQSITLKDS